MTSAHRSETENSRSALTRRRVVDLEKRLDARSGMEKALFDGDAIAIPMLMIPAAVWAVEIAANLANGHDWSSAAHLLVIAPLEALVLLAVGLGLRSVCWRARLKWLRAQMGERKGSLID